jgi:hypothetical protein
VSDETMRRTAKAIHTLFYATQEAHSRYLALRESVTTDEELEAYQNLSVGLINFDPIPDEVMAEMQVRAAAIEAATAKGPKEPNERVSIEANDSEEGRYVKRLLERMYAEWQGTLDYERGVHRFVFFSPFDEQGRRHTSFASVAIDGEASELQARSYILGPYLSVKDERTQRESNEPWRVLGGDLTPILPDTGHRPSGGYQEEP